MKIRNYYSERSRVSLKTPAKGSIGDKTDESQAGLTDVVSILKRYGGNLEELKRWRGSARFEDNTLLPTDLTEAYDKIKSARDAFDAIPNNPFTSFDDAVRAYAEGTFDDVVNNLNTPVESEVSNVSEENVEEGK